jgi:hypothetical protein
MPHEKFEFPFGLWERLAVTAFIAGVAGIAVSVAYPLAYPESAISIETWRFVLWLSIFILGSAVLFFICDLGLQIARSFGVKVGTALTSIGTILIVVGAIVGLIGAFRIDYPTKEPDADTPWVYAVPQSQGNEIKRIVAAIGARGRTRQHNVNFSFYARTTDKPRKGAGDFFVALLDPGSTTTNFELEPGDYFITMRSDAGVFTETLNLTIENGLLQQKIRIMNDKNAVIWQADRP